VPHCVHFIVLACFLLTTAHVQIATRVLGSGCAPFYWLLADISLRSGGGESEGEGECADEDEDGRGVIRQVNMFISFQYAYDFTLRFDIIIIVQ
jgi:hypothetical protein